MSWIRCHEFDVMNSVAALTEVSQLWWHPGGDALARLRAAGAYGFALSRVLGTEGRRGKEDSNKIMDGKGKRFTTALASSSSSSLSTSSPAAISMGQEVAQLCASQQLSEQTLHRASDLRTQLVRIVETVFQNEVEHAAEAAANNELEQVKPPEPTGVDWASEAPPSSAEEQQLRQTLVTAYSDCIAKRAPPGLIKTGSRRRRLTAYLSCDPAISEALYIHPHSALYSKDPTAELPEYVVYSSLITNTKGDMTYMNCVTPIAPAWIPTLTRDCPLLQWGSPLQSPSPFYSEDLDCVMCYCIPRYGVHKWDLAPVKRPLQECIAIDSSAAEAEATTPVGYRKSDESYRWFARLLLEGAVVNDGPLKSVLRKDKLKEPAAIITHMKPTAKVSSLLRKLISNQIQSRASFMVALARDKTFLSDEIEQFLGVEMRKSFRAAYARLSEAAGARN